MYQLISLDMDATTLMSDHTISDQTIKVLRRASQQGIEILMNTGRTYSEAKEYIEALDFVNYAALANGSVIYDKRANDFIRVNNMSIDLIAKAHEFSMMYADEVAFVVSGERHTYSDSVYRKSKGAEQHRRICGEGNLRFVDDLVTMFSDRFIAKGLLIGSHKTLLKIKNQLHDHFGDKIQLVFSLECALEILDPSMDKSNALHRIMQLKGLDKTQVIAIGDGENDLGMLRAAGVAVAMGNAVEKLKNAADFVTLTNNEDGVAYAVNKLIFSI
ncbi:MAG: Cof-type HAD-IIB family hydrolase [Peptostreptococcaceae bacterium]|nr:Cof-type HAD-IIB family hydrolase [Peptostreptococcaceae bacterium]